MCVCDGEGVGVNLCVSLCVCDLRDIYIYNCFVSTVTVLDLHNPPSNNIHVLPSHSNYQSVFTSPFI